MNSNIKSLWLDWREAVPNGIPNISNAYHLVILKELCIKKGINKNIIDKVILTLEKKDKKPTREVITETSEVPVFEDIDIPISKQEVTEFYIKVGEILSEASIHKEKYPIGHRVDWSSGGEAAFRKKLPSGASMIQMPAEKTQAADDAIQVIQNPNGVEFYLKDSSNTYHIQGTEGTISSWFKHFSGNDEFKLNTEGKESAALLGMYIDAKSYLDKLNALSPTDADEKAPKILKKFKKEVRSTFGNGQDWTRHDIIGKLETASIQNLIQLAAIASGMQKFAKDKGVFGWNIVHGKINDYYKAEQENPNLVTEGGKDNTADCVIVNSDVSSFIKNMKSNSVSYDGKGLCTLKTGEKFYQVSLKEVEGGAQLGKITADFTAKFGARDTKSLANSFLTEDFDPGVLNEGLKDLWNKGKEFVKSTGQKLLASMAKLANKLKGFYQGLKGKINSVRKQADKDNDTFILKLANKHIKKEKGNPKLKAFFKDFIKEGKLNEAGNLKSVNDAIQLIAASQSAQDDLYKEVNSKLTQLITDCNNKGILFTKRKPYGVKSIPKQTQDVNGVRKLMMNIRAFDALSRIIKSEKGKIKDASSIFEELIDLEKSMYFGRTSLPLFKVYGLDSTGSGKAYVFLKTGKEYAEEKRTSIEKVDIALIVMVSAKKGYGTVGTFMLSQMKDGVIYYNDVKFRSNSSTGFSFVIEGSGIVSLEKLKTDGYLT